MELQEVKKNLNKMVVYKGKKGVYELKACIIRKNDNGYFYQAEVLDKVSGNSTSICSLSDISEE